MTGFVKTSLCSLLLLISVLRPSDCTDVSIVLSSADENVTVRSTVILVCVAYSSNSPPTIVWYTNGAVVNNATSIRHTVYNSTTTSSGLVFAESILEICSIGLEEAGEYECHASNRVHSTTNTTTLNVMARGDPERPCNCTSVPVYSETGTLTSVEFNWTEVSTPPVVVDGVNPNITSYSVSVDGFGSHIVPAESVCVESSSSHLLCSYSYPVPTFKAGTSQGELRAAGNVAALNQIGQGKACMPSLNNIGQMNSYMTVSVDAAGGSVTCTRGQGLSSGQSFWCDFCYNSDAISCQSPMTCIRIPDGTSTLTGLSEGTYCYRATALVDERPAAVVQDTFSFHQQRVSLVTPLSASVTTSFVVAFIIGLVVGCVFCLCYYRQRAKKLPQRDLLNSTNGTAIKEDIGGVYETIPLPGKDIQTDSNEAYGRIPKPIW